MLLDPAVLAFGAIVGLSLGLTGSGGSILAIPLLIYGVGLPVQEALVISLFMVAGIAAFGAIRQSINGNVDWKAAGLFSLSGMIISPAVVTLTHDVNETLRLVLFAILMLFVATRMAFYSPNKQTSSTASTKGTSALAPIALGGAVAGTLAGFFGVGGGFIIVPLLTLIFAMPYKQAVGTSLACIALISSSALLGSFIKGISLDWFLLLTFTTGGGAGLLLGTMLVNKIPEFLGKRLFAATTALLALFMLVEKLFLHQGGLS